MAVLCKTRLALLVVFSAAFGYGFASLPQDTTGYIHFFGFLVGAFLITGSASACNQLLEVRFDAMMHRTRTRPLPAGLLSAKEGAYLALVFGLLGFFFIFFFTNPLTLLLSFTSFFMYACVYTYAKRTGPLAVLWGAIPGAMPPLLGYVGNAGHLSYEGVLMFAIQFIWQFPHFWAIAWLLADDYKRAGFQLLPGEKGVGAALCIVVYTLFLIPLGLLPSYYGVTGLISGGVATLCGIAFLCASIRLLGKRSQRAASHLKFSSFFYLPIVQMAYLLDKITPQAPL